MAQYSIKAIKDGVIATETFSTEEQRTRWHALLILNKWLVLEQYSNEK